MKKHEPDVRLKSLLSLPTAPFHERFISSQIENWAQEDQVIYTYDSSGNMILGYGAPKIVFVAHMDHPGWILSSKPHRITKNQKKGTAPLIVDALWQGGGPQMNLGQKVCVFSDPSQSIFTGWVKSTKATPRGPGATQIEIEISDREKDLFQNPRQWAACLDFGSPYLLQKDLIYTKAADDLAGVCALYESYLRAKKPRGMYLLFSRAEEGGFFGTLAHLKKTKFDPHRTFMMSVECSGELPGAIVGKGPILRLGDRSTLFDSHFVSYLQKNLPQHPFYQKQVMDRGSCEASAFALWGFSVGGFSLPLGNYHNIPHTLQGQGTGSTTKTSTAQPEIISLRDYSDLVSHLSSVMSLTKIPNPKQMKATVTRETKKRWLTELRAHRIYF